MQGHYVYQHTFSQIPVVCKRIIMINVVVFLIQGISYPWIDYYFSLYSISDPNFRIWQPISYLFLHGGFFHLLFNMIVVWMFGAPFENNFGSRRFLELYFLSGVLTGIFYSLIEGNFRLIGASAATYGLLTSFAYFWPRSQILIFGIFPVQAKNFILGLMVIGIISSIRRDPSDNVASVAHLLGASIGFIYLQIIYRSYSLKNLFGSLKTKLKHARRQNQKLSQKKTKSTPNYYSVHLSNQEANVNASKPNAEFNEQEENEQEQLDQIFNKIMQEGAESLNEEEKNFLKQVQHNRDKKMH